MYFPCARRLDDDDDDDDEDDGFFVRLNYPAADAIARSRASAAQNSKKGYFRERLYIRPDIIIPSLSLCIRTRLCIIFRLMGPIRSAVLSRPHPFLRVLYRLFSIRTFDILFLRDACFPCNYLYCD